ncbi:MAG TPA: PIN domain-containing protein [Methylophilus sp.]|nr:PIN domain-containing protein [Methylophilus sp.]
MKNIFIDSTVFKNDKSRVTYKFSQLSTLARSGLIKLHTSRINVKEFESSIDEEFNVLISSISENITKTSKYLLQDPSYSKLQQLIQETSQVLTDSIVAARAKFHAWLTDNHVSVHEVESDDANNVINSYFSGSEPFKKLKNRDDFPDAFIWQVLARLNAAHEDKLYFVSKDKNFQDKVKEYLPHFVVTESLDELLELSELQSCIEQEIQAKKTLKLDTLKCLITGELKVQKQEISAQLIKLISKELLGSTYSDQSEQIYGEVTDIRFSENVSFETQDISYTDYPTVYLISENTIDITVTNTFPAHGFWEGAYTPTAFSRIVELSENSSDTHHTIHNDLLLEVKSEFVMELRGLDLDSVKDNVIDAFEVSEIDLVKVTKSKV